MHALAAADELAKDFNIADWAEEGLVAAALIVVVVYVFADDPPVGEVEDIAAEDLVGVGEAVEDKARTVSYAVWR